MSNWILSLAFRWGFSWGKDYTAQQARKDTALVGALIKYRSGGTFMDICRSYATLTPDTTDDQVVESIEQLKRDLTAVPFKDLVQTNWILARIADQKIPDFDGDPSNDAALGDALGEIVDKVIEQ